ncbi:MAG: alpha/beta fold hydrolase, partial [Gammaproteobacteria bacterium]|nr:alpha/beta fold hydrolase [Gammaproteobacteria bacterium]
MRFKVDGRTAFAGTGTGRAGADAATVVFVHGAAMDHTVWVLPSRYFARQGYRVLAFDLPGHGRS